MENWSKWTEKEKKNLLEIIDSGAGFEEASNQIGRTVGACKNKYALMRQRKKKINSTSRDTKTAFEKEIIEFAKKKRSWSSQKIANHFKIGNWRVLQALKGSGIKIENSLEYQAKMAWTASGKWNVANKTGLN